MSTAAKTLRKRLEEIQELNPAYRNEGPDLYPNLIGVIKSMVDAKDHGQKWDESQAFKVDGDDGLNFFKCSMELAKLYEKIFEEHGREGKLDDVLLILGNTGTGKSTLASILMDPNIQSTILCEEILDDQNNPVVDDCTGETMVSERWVLQGTAVEEIGHDPLESATLLPHYCGFSEELSKHVWDFPGFEDTRSKAFNVGILEGYKMFLRMSKSTRIVMCMPSIAIANDRSEVDKLPRTFAMKMPCEDRFSFFVSLNYSVPNDSRKQQNGVYEKLSQLGLHYGVIDLANLEKVRGRYIQRMKEWISTKAPVKFPQESLQKKDQYFVTRVLLASDIKEITTQVQARMAQDVKTINDVYRITSYQRSTEELQDSFQKLGNKLETGGSISLSDFATMFSKWKKEHHDPRTKNFNEVFHEMTQKLKWTQGQEELFNCISMHDGIDDDLKGLLKSRDSQVVRIVNSEELRAVLAIMADELTKKKKQMLEECQGVLKALQGTIDCISDGKLSGTYTSVCKDVMDRIEEQELRETTTVQMPSSEYLRIGALAVEVACTVFYLALKITKNRFGVQVPTVMKALRTACKVLPSVANVGASIWAEMDQRQQSQVIDSLLSFLDVIRQLYQDVGKAEGVFSSAYQYSVNNDLMLQECESEAVKKCFSHQCSMGD